MATIDEIFSTVAGRYASALFELAGEAGQLAAVEGDLNTFQKLYDESPDLARMVRSPVIPADQQANALDAVLAKAGVGQLVRNFFRLITRNRRLFVATDIVRAFRSYAARSRGEVAAEVTSAHPLSDAQTQALKDALKASIGKDVMLTTRVDPTLLGGLIVKMGSRMVDSSLRTKLNSLRLSMKGGL